MCDDIVARLIRYIQYTVGDRHQRHVGDPVTDCKLGLVSRPIFCWRRLQDSQSIPDGILCNFG